MDCVRRAPMDDRDGLLFVMDAVRGAHARCWCKGFKVTCGLGGGRWRVTGVAGGGGGRA